MEQQIVITKLNRNEALRYMGQHGECDGRLEELLNECENIILSKVKPRFLYKCFDIEQTDAGVAVKGTSLVLLGNSIAEHLKGCDKAVLLCATLLGDVDREIRIAELSDMLRALTLDCMASVAVEQLCDKIEMHIKKDFPGYYMTWRYGIGYGDLPISQQREFLNVLNAPRLIGLNVTESNILTPRKSVTAIIGLSKHEIGEKKRGCETCNLREKCSLRKKGSYCNV